MNPEIDDLTLDLERCHKIQALLVALDQLMTTENRGVPEYVQIRHKLLDAADDLYKASLIYLELIEKRKAGNNDGPLPSPPS